MITRPDQPVRIDQLNREISVLGLPGFQGSARLSRDLGARQAVPPYLLIKFDDPNSLTARQLADLDDVLSAHVPEPEPVQASPVGSYTMAKLLSAMQNEVSPWESHTHPPDHTHPELP